MPDLQLHVLTARPHTSSEPQYPHTDSPNWSLYISLNNNIIRCELLKHQNIIFLLIDLKTFCIDDYC